MAVLTSAAFDVNVFDTALFDASEVTPVIVKLAVPREMQVAELGMTIAIFAYIYNYETSPGTAIPMNLVMPPEIQVYDPYDFTELDFQPMTNVDDGVYRYQYSVPNNGWYGAYSARVRAVNGAMSTLSKKAVVFTIHD